jgi:hypothetical protein
MHDLNYTDDGVIIRFYPNTQAGIDAYNIMANAQNGCANIFSFHKNTVFAQLRRAGITISKENPRDLDLEELLHELVG